MAGKKLDTPVMFAAGRARLVTMPLAIGSLTMLNTIGMPALTRCIACADGVPDVISTSGRSATSSAASAGRSESLPEAQRRSTLMLRPSVHPSLVSSS